MFFLPTLQHTRGFDGVGAARIEPIQLSPLHSWGYREGERPEFAKGNFAIGVTRSE